MYSIILDATQMNTRESAHKYLSSMLEFPDYYGENLDALFDCLTEIGQETELVLRLFDEYEKNEYLNKIVKVMKEAHMENPHLHITLIK